MDHEWLAVRRIFKVSDGVPLRLPGHGGDPQGLLNSDDWAFPDRLTTPVAQRLPIRIQSLHQERVLLSPHCAQLRILDGELRSGATQLGALLTLLRCNVLTFEAMQAGIC